MHRLKGGSDHGLILQEGITSLQVRGWNGNVHIKEKMGRIADIDIAEFPLLLAPMEDVSDPPFRALCKKYGADLMYTEFISSEGLIRCLLYTSDAADE